jgi:hypothetical protein
VLLPTLVLNMYTAAEDFSSSPCIQTSSGAHPASYPMGIWGSFPGGKARPGRDADHSPPSSAKVKNEQELYLLSPHVPPWCVAGQLLQLFQVGRCLHLDIMSWLYYMVLVIFQQLSHEPWHSEAKIW